MAMNKFDRALQEICSLEKEAASEGWLNQMHPLIKLFLTLWFTGFVMSFSNMELMGLLSMGLYPLAAFLLADIPFLKCLKRMKLALAALLLIGLSNLIFADSLAAGVCSMAGLWIKGILTVFSVYLLAVTTRIEDLCEGLRILHVPEILITVILLIYRYINILIKETKKLAEAYRVLAPGQNGIHIKAWGPFLGQLMLRSIDRAHVVYDSMNLRGYEWNALQASHKRYPVTLLSVVWLIVWMLAVVLFRTMPVFELAGAALFG